VSGCHIDIYFEKQRIRERELIKGIVEEEIKDEGKRVVSIIATVRIKPGTNKSCRYRDEVYRL
jgi:hypothetical protein